MDIAKVDPRFIDQELGSPTYWVHFWRRHESGIPEHAQNQAFESDEYELTNATNVFEVFSWAEGRARADQTFCVYVVVDGVRVRLYGKEPTIPENL